MLRVLVLLCGGWLCVAVALAQPQVRVVGLFPGAALLNIDGQRSLLKVGRSGPQGIELLEADSNSALLKIDGQTRRFGLEREYSAGGYAEPQKQVVRLVRDSRGHYFASGLINGRSLTFMLDTGATAIALNQVQARALGLDYQRGEKVPIRTASGNSWAWRITLDSVSVAGIRITSVTALVTPGNYPEQALLGMSFLNHVHWREEQGILVLESKY